MGDDARETEVIELLTRATPDQLRVMVLMLLLERKTPRDDPPDVSIAEMAEWWGTLGVGPWARP